MKAHSLGGLLCISNALAIIHLAAAISPAHDNANSPASVGLDTDSPIFALPVSHLDTLGTIQLPPVYAVMCHDGQNLASTGNKESIGASPLTEDGGKDDEEESKENVRYADDDDENEEWGDKGDRDKKYVSLDENDSEADKEDDRSDTIDGSDGKVHNPAWNYGVASRIARLNGYYPPLDPKESNVAQKNPSIDPGKTNIDTTKPKVDPIKSNIISSWINNPERPLRHDAWSDRALDPCAVVSRYGSKPIPYMTVKACLDSDFPFPSNHRAETAATLKSLIANFYVYEDLAANPSLSDQRLSFLPVDIQTDVDRLLQVSDISIKVAISAGVGEGDESDDQEGKAFSVNSQALQALVAGLSDILDKPDIGNIAAASKMTDRAFHDGLSRILAKARDGHLSYDADCFRAFRWQQGFFMNHIVRDKKVVLKVHSITSDLAEAAGLQQDLLNCDVISIEGLDAAEYIQQWADAQVSMSKDADVRFNAALASPQYRPGFTDFFIFGKFGDRYSLPPESSLDYVFKCPGQLPVKTSVKWLGTYTHMESKPFWDIKSYFAANCMNQADLTYFRDKASTDRSKLEEEEIKEEEQMILQLRARLRDMFSHPNTETEVPSDTPANSHLETLQEALHQSRLETPMPEDTPKPQTVKEIIAQLDMLTSEKLPIVKFYDDLGGRPSELSESSSGATFKELYQGAYDITAILLADGETGVLTVRTESSTIQGERYSKVHPAWIGSLIQAIYALRPFAKNLILDLTHNTGGYICLGIAMVQLFFPDRPRLVTNIKLTPLSTQMLTSGALGMDGFISSYGKQVAPVYNDGHFMHTIKHLSRNETFTDYLSDRCATADQYVLSVDPALEAKRHRAPLSNMTANRSRADDDASEHYRPWNPENMAILTEGYCGSSCALISNMMHTKYGVPTVAIGGRELAEQAKPMSYSSFPGLQVIDDAFIFSEMSNMRSQMMSIQELERLEKGRHANKEDGSAAHGQSVLSRPQILSKDNDDDEVDEDDDLKALYPQQFLHKSRLRLTWRQMYNTGPEIEAFRTRPGAPGSGKDVWSMYEPMWKEVDQWYEYGFLPASYRIDYTDQNIHSIGAIWENARDAVWGAKEGSKEGSHEDNEED